MLDRISGSMTMVVLPVAAIDGVSSVSVARTYAQAPTLPVWRRRANAEDAQVEPDLQGICRVRPFLG